MNNQTLLQSPPYPQMPAVGEPAAGREPRGLEGLSQQARNVQALIDRAQEFPDSKARALIKECLQSLLAFYGDGLSRLLEMVRHIGPGGDDLLKRFAQDRAISGLLLIHGLHPIDLETRLREALEKVRPYLESHGGGVELVSLSEGFARLHLHGACQTCPSSSVTLELAVRRALEEACPDLLGFKVE